MSMLSSPLGDFIKPDEKSFKDEGQVELHTQDADIKGDTDGDIVSSAYQRTHYTHADEAAIATDELLQDQETAKHLKSGTRKLDWMVVPALLLMWLANFVDRSNAGNARIAGLETDLKLMGRQFNEALAIFYVSESSVSP